jgi:bifunctional non-homologous end joining protein LigD
MRLASLREPFDLPEWLFELKYDGFRALATVGALTCLVSRHQHVYKQYTDLCAALTADLQGRSAVLDGEIVCLDDTGRPLFYELLHRRRPTYYYAFDLLELDGQNLRSWPLVQRKRILRPLIPQSSSRLLYADHVDGTGVQLYHATCANDLEGIVAKWKHGHYYYGSEQPPDRRLTLHASNPTTASRLTWLKIKNPTYTQIVGRDELFKARAAGNGSVGTVMVMPIGRWRGSYP